MKKWTVMVLGCFFLFAGAANADHCKGKSECDATHAKYIDKKVTKLGKKLDLTPEQKTQVRAALEKKMQAKEAIHAEVHQKMKPVYEDYRATMNGILNETQRQKYEKLMEKYRDKDDCKKCGDKGECPHKG